MVKTITETDLVRGLHWLFSRHPIFLLTPRINDGPKKRDKEHEFEDGTGSQSYSPEEDLSSYFTGKLFVIYKLSRYTYLPDQPVST